MTNTPLILQPLYKYAEFNGRSRRSEFWLWTLLLFVVNSAVSAIGFSVLIPFLMNIETETPPVFPIYYIPVMGLAQIVQLGALIPTIAVSVRRLHDINRTGWWLALPYVVQFAGLIIFFVFLFGNILALASVGEDNRKQFELVMNTVVTLALSVILPSLIAWIVMLVFFVTDGTPGPNRFGADPKGRGVSAPASPPLSPADAPEEMH